MGHVAWFLFAIGCMGSASSTVFLGLALLGTIRFRGQSGEQARAVSKLQDSDLPPVSILKPLHGNETQLEKNIESFFQQDYPAYEILLAVDHEDDAALPIALAVCARYPAIPSRVLVTGEPPWPNPPAYSFARMAEVATHEILVTSDSDVIVSPSYLREVVPPLMDPKIGMLTCVYRGLNRGGLWSNMDAIGMSVEMTAGVMVANLLEGIKFGLGPTIVVRRDALEGIGGYRSLGDYFSNDFAIGNMIAAEGREIVLSRHIITHVVPPMSFKKMWHRQVRWATGTRRSRPLGHLGTGLIFATPFGILAAITGPAVHHGLLGAGLLGWSILNRMIESMLIGWGVTRSRESLTRPWLYPLRDLLGFSVWLASYMSRSMRWRDGRFELVRGGKILQRDRNGNVIHMGAS
ncbi:MAG TPA: glycosyltransferase [Acidisarcina sp.]